jgi:hypothetical protein
MRPASLAVGTFEQAGKHEKVGNHRQQHMVALRSGLEELQGDHDDEQRRAGDEPVDRAKFEEHRAECAEGDEPHELAAW